MRININPNLILNYPKHKFSSKDNQNLTEINLTNLMKSIITTSTHSPSNNKKENKLT